MGHQVLHRQFRIADHRLASVLQQAGMPASCPRDGGFHCLPAWLGNARQYNLGEAIQECEQRPAGLAPKEEDIPPDLLDSGRESLFGPDEFLAAIRQFLFHRMAG